MSNTTDISKAAELLLENYYTVKVIFASRDDYYDSAAAKKYTYKVPKELELKPDDLVIVRVRGSGFCKIVKVVSIDEEIDIDYNFNKDYTWIVQKVDEAGIELREEMDRKIRKSFEIVKKRQMRKELLKELANDLGSEEFQALTSDLGLTEISTLVESEPSTDQG